LEIEENRRRQLNKCREQIQFLREAAKEYSDGNNQTCLEWREEERGEVIPFLPSHLLILIFKYYFIL